MKKFLAKTLNSSCLYFMISSFILNFIAWIFSENNHNRMLTIWANLLVFLICIIISIYICYKKRKKLSKTNFFENALCKYGIYKSCIIYVLTFFLLNITQYIIKVENFWNAYSILIIILFSIVASFLIIKVKFKSYLANSFINYFVIGIFYYIFYVIKANFNSGNAQLISIGIYTLLYIACAFTYYLIIAKKRCVKNSEENYKNLFT